LNTKLRLLIDESIEDPLADAVDKMTAFNVVCVRDMPDLRGRSDKEVMKRAKADDRIVLTTDHGFNKANYPICRHGGIIRISTRCKHSSVMLESVRKFAQCGRRSTAKHAITVINQEGYAIETIDRKWSGRYK
jgi:predicted nuclease of predicted toxin-antitoxin system